MSRFHIATPDGPEEVDGFVLKFLGIHSTSFWLDRWSVTHIPTGHKLGTIAASFGTAKLILKELSQIADWGFHEMSTWRSHDPGLAQKAVDFQQEFGEFTVSSGTGGSVFVARKVSMLNVASSPLPTQEG